MLTPDDVRNVAFRTPPIGRRGYRGSDVDEFLDQVENTLRNLYERLAHHEGRPAP